MMPGMGQFKDQLAEVDDSHFDQITAIIRVMTPGERDEPEDHQRLPPGPHRQRLRRHRHGREPAAQPLRRRAEDDEADGRHDGPARRAARRPSRPKNKRKGTKGGSSGPRSGGMPAGLPGGFPGGMPQLPPGLDPSGLAGGFKAPKLDFSKLPKQDGK